MKEFDFENTPIVDIVNDIILSAVKLNASDIHFDPSEKNLKIRLRVDGDLMDYSFVDNKYKRNLITRVKLLAGMNITESRLPQDGAIKSTIEGTDLDLRVSALPTSFGEKVVVRILDYSMSLQGLEHLGFSKENYELIMKMLANPNGIILITGATGSGKSTTVYSMLQKLNKEETNIITVEDPVEMNIEGLNQVQVNSEIGLTFATVLRSILRQDPNVILIGEIRDSETARIAIRSSITGHLVLSTLHTNNSLTTIERLIDMDVERYLLSSSLKGIISQTLAKRLCPKCATKRPTTEAEKRIFKKALGLDINEISEPGKPGTCPNCHSGFKGRIALQEVLYLNDDIRDAINKNVDRQELRRLIYKRDVHTLLQDGLLKVILGITSIEEVFRLVDVDDDIDNIFSGKEEKIDNSTIKEDASKEEVKVTQEIVNDKPPVVEPTPVEITPVTTPTIETPTANTQPEIATPTVETPKVNTQPEVTTPTIETPKVNTQPEVTTPTIETPAVNVQPEITPVTTPTIETPTVNTQPEVTTPTIETPAVNVQPEITPVTTPTIETPTVNTQPEVTTPTVETPKINTQPEVTTPNVGTPKVNTQPEITPVTTPTIETPAVNVQPTPVTPTIETPTVNVQPVPVTTNVETPTVNQPTPITTPAPTPVTNNQTITQPKTNPFANLRVEQPNIQPIQPIQPTQQVQQPPVTTTDELIKKINEGLNK